MRKLRLDLEELSVESFGTGPEPVQRGTVHGQASERCNTNWSCEGTCGPMVCGNTYYCVATEATCDNICIPNTGSTSCNQPCINTCGGASCNVQNTCVQTCAGMPTCALATCAGYPQATCGC
jgi:hypothetical protein